MTDHLVLMGLMGSGKTTVGARLASRLGRPYRDSDADIEADHGLTARALAERDGIDALHELERQHLLRSLADPGASVVSAAASTIEEPLARAALQRPGVTAIWLRGSPATLASRHSPKDHRPEFGEDIEAVIAEQAARRDPLFAAVADRIMDVDDRTAEQIVDELDESQH
jgi:shikimate kinase